MKWIGRILYIIMVVIITIFVTVLSLSERDYRYYSENTSEFIDNYNSESYMEVFMTTYGVNNFLKEPLYSAVSDVEGKKLELEIYHAKVGRKEEYNYLFLHFVDLGVDYIKDFKETDEYKNNEDGYLMQAQIFFDGLDNSTLVYFSLNREMQMPADFARVIQDDKDNMKFNYIQYDDNQTNGENQFGEEISKIDLSVVKYSNDKFEVLENILEINHNSLNNNERDLLEEENNLLISNTFNGDISNYDVDSKYLDDDLVGTLRISDYKKYNRVIVKSLTTYSLIVISITYLLFFLRPTINYFKRK